MVSTGALTVGAGVAGLMCTMMMAGRGRHVRTLNHADKADKKTLMSDGGCCNFANLYAEPASFLSRDPHLCKSVLARCTRQDFIGLVAKHQVPYHEKKLDQLLCDDRSSDILEALLRECAETGAGILLDTSVEEVARDDTGYCLCTSTGKMRCESLVIAGSGLSIPTLGANDFGHQATRQFSHEVLPTCAGLVPFTITDQLKELCAKLSGTSMDCRVSCDGQVFHENLLFTHHGLNGPAMLQISFYWQPGDTLEINLLPGHNASEWLAQQQCEHPNSGLKTLFAELFIKKLAGLLADHWFVSKPMKQYTPTELAGIAEQLSAWQVTPSGIEGYRTAEVTLGGMSTDEVSSKTTRPQRSPGLYFVGEVLDINGHLDSFSFQWAWALGYAARQYT